MLRCVAFGAAAVLAASVSAAGASDFSVPAPPPPETSQWDGLYFGAHAGYGWGDWDVDLTHSSGAIHYNDYFVPPYGKLGPANGWLAGIQVGANKQMGSGLIGIEADASWTGITGSGRFTTAAPNYATWDINSQLVATGTVRGRLGVTNGPWLLYGTAGLAWGITNTRQETNWFAPAPPDVGGRTSGLTNHIGYAAGAGLEYMFAPNWTLKAEYLFVDLGKTNYALNGTNKPPSDPAAIPYTETFATALKLQTVRLGVNYLFH